MDSALAIDLHVERHAAPDPPVREVKALREEAPGAGARMGKSLR
jgi:hypothetical protein